VHYKYTDDDDNDDIVCHNAEKKPATFCNRTIIWRCCIVLLVFTLHVALLPLQLSS